MLLGSIAVGRAWFGVSLVVAYGIGMAATLTLAGFALLKARTAIKPARHRGSRAPAAARHRPRAAAARALTITTVGLYLAVRALGQL